MWVGRIVLLKVLSQVLDGPCRDAHEICDFAVVERVCRVFGVGADAGGILRGDSFAGDHFEITRDLSFWVGIQYIYVDGADCEFLGTTGVMSLLEFWAAHGESATQGSGCGSQNTECQHHL
jgi:hypothetical protein